MASADARGHASARSMPPRKSSPAGVLPGPVQRTTGSTTFSRRWSLLVRRLTSRRSARGFEEMGHAVQRLRQTSSGRCGKSRARLVSGANVTAVLYIWRRAESPAGGRGVPGTFGSQSARRSKPMVSPSPGRAARRAPITDTPADNRETIRRSGTIRPIGYCRAVRCRMAISRKRSPTKVGFWSWTARLDRSTPARGACGRSADSSIPLGRRASLCSPLCHADARCARRDRFAPGSPS